MLKAHLLVIDPQNDFADILAGPPGSGRTYPPDGTRFRSALPVPGTLEDMERVAKLVKRAGRRLDGIHVTLDSHRVIDVALSTWYMAARHTRDLNVAIERTK